MNLIPKPHFAHAKQNEDSLNFAFRSLSGPDNLASVKKWRDSEGLLELYQRVNNVPKDFPPF